MRIISDDGRGGCYDLFLKMGFEFYMNSKSINMRFSIIFDFTILIFRNLNIDK